MLIAQAWAADSDIVQTTAEIQAPGVPVNSPAEMPSAGKAFMLNMGMVLVLVVLFYVLLIMPQQRRFKEHRKMLSGLQKGDPVVTGGGLVGKIDTIVNDDEMIVDLGNGMKVTALRSTIHAKNAAVLKGKPANDQKTAAKK
ncbi:MAG: preprotein translocase subunit YajC [Alphaproteobacteria bacterium]